MITKTKFENWGKNGDLNIRGEKNKLVSSGEKKYEKGREIPERESH